MPLEGLKVLPGEHRMLTQWFKMSLRVLKISLECFKMTLIGLRMSLEGH